MRHAHPTPATTRRSNLRPHPRLVRLTAAAATAALLTSLLSGCGLSYRSGWNPGGSGVSVDKYTYVSEPWEPKTVELVDTRTGETLWSVDVPVGQQLAVRFYPDREKDNAYTPDLMRWDLMEAGTRFRRLENSMLVPASNARRLDMSLRTAPEFPE